MNMDENVPMVAIGNDELGDTLQVGDVVKCPNCGHDHLVAGSTPPILLSVKCGDASYLVGIKNRRIRTT
jgi:DNA-directed RNA polymerase subunit RPC12/RpoP